MIDGYLTKLVYYSGDTIWDRYFEVFDDDGMPMIPVVKLNGEEVELYNYSSAIRLLTYWDTIHFSTGQKYELTVDHYQGQAHANIWMPGEFSMIGPDSNYILKRDSALLVTWHKSEKASRYYFYIYMDYEFIDTTGEEDDIDFFHDTIVYDTFIRYEPNRFIPDYVEMIVGGDVEAGVWAINGPIRWEQGTKGNIRGQGYGYFSATYQPKELDFYVGAPLKKPKLRNCSKVWERLRERMRTNNNLNTERHRISNP